MTDDVDEKPNTLPDAEIKPTKSDPCTPAADLSSAEQGSLNETPVTSDDGKEEVNSVNGLPRYLLAFGLMCALFCVSLAPFQRRR